MVVISPRRTGISLATLTVTSIGLLSEHQCIESWLPRCLDILVYILVAAIAVVTAAILAVRTIIEVPNIAIVTPQAVKVGVIDVIEVGWLSVCSQSLINLVVVVS
jgi:hypothetical protein